MLTREKKREIVEHWDKDCLGSGSTTVQIALMCEKINDLTQHLSIHKKDFQARRRLLIHVGNRRKMIKYLKKEDISACSILASHFGLRRV